MSQDVLAKLRPVTTAWEGQVGAFNVEVHRTADGGSLVLSPPEGEPLTIRLHGDRLELAYAGPSVRLTAPGADLELAARNVTITAEDTVALHGGREVDLHSGEDVEIRADHQVNLWAHSVLVGD